MHPAQVVCGCRSAAPRAVGRVAAPQCPGAHPHRPPAGDQPRPAQARGDAGVATVVGGLGHTDVVTYISERQRGVHRVRRPTTPPSPTDLEKAIADELGVTCRVVVLTSAELARTVADNPYPDEPDPRRPARDLPDRAPRAGRPGAPRAGPRASSAGKIGRDEVQIIGRTVYLHTPDGFGRSELAKVLSRPPRGPGRGRPRATGRRSRSCSRCARTPRSRGRPASGPAGRCGGRRGCRRSVASRCCRAARRPPARRRPRSRVSGAGGVAVPPAGEHAQGRLPSAAGAPRRTRRAAGSPAARGSAAGRCPAGRATPLPTSRSSVPPADGASLPVGGEQEAGRGSEAGAAARTRAPRSGPTTARTSTYPAANEPIRASSPAARASEARISENSPRVSTVRPMLAASTRPNPCIRAATIPAA